MEVARSGSRFPRLLAITTSSLALGFAVAVSMLALREHIRVPYLDDWRLLDEMYLAPLGTWLFSVQTGHRMPATLLLLHLDQTLAGGRMHLLVAASLACAWISAALLALALRGSRSSEWGLRPALLGFGVFALFWSGSGFNFQWGVNQGSVWTPMWLLVSVVAMTRAMEGIETKRAARWVLLAAGAALLATFGHGMGVLTWAALLAMAAARRMPWRVGAGLAAGGLLSVGLYSVGLFGSGNAPAEAGSLLALFGDRPGDLLLFVCAFLGAPLGWTLRGLGAVGANGMQGLSTALGAAAVALACAYGALAFRRRADLPSFGLVGFALMVFALGGGLLVGLARLEFYGASQAVDRRFLSWSTLFWIGGAWALGSLAAGRGARLALTGSLAALSLAMLPAFFEAREHAAARKALANDVAFALMLGARPDPLLVGVMRQSPEVVGRAAEHLSRERRSPFDDERSGLAGTSFAERFTAAEQRPCGSAPELRPRAPRGDLVTVWGRLDRDGLTPAYLVVVDSKRVIRGLGEERPPPPDAEPARRWEGVIAPFAPGERYAAWAVLNDGRSACAVGEIEGLPEGRR
jgi:hypothetical protein